MARSTKVTTTTKDSSAKHSGGFKGGVSSARGPGKVSDSAKVDAQGIRNHQHGVYSSYTVVEGTITESLPAAGLDTDTN